MASVTSGWQNAVSLTSFFVSTAHLHAAFSSKVTVQTNRVDFTAISMDGNHLLWPKQSPLVPWHSQELATTSPPSAVAFVVSPV